MLVEAAPNKVKLCLSTEYKMACAARLQEAGLLGKIHPEDIPDFCYECEEGKPPKFHVGAEPVMEGKVIMLPPILVVPGRFAQIRSEQLPEIIFTFAPKDPFEMHWLYGITVSDAPSENAASSIHLPSIMMGYGDAACAVAQFPSLERCRVEQPLRIRMQAYMHKGLGRIVLDAQQYKENQYHHMLRIHWNGGRTLKGEHQAVRYHHVAD